MTLQRFDTPCNEISKARSIGIPLSSQMKV